MRLYLLKTLSGTPGTPAIPGGVPACSDCKPATDKALPNLEHLEHLEHQKTNNIVNIPDAGEEVHQADEWRQLAASGLSDLDFDDLARAYFLSVLRHLRESGDPTALWTRCAPYWKDRMEPEVWAIIEEVYQDIRRAECGRQDQGPADSLRQMKTQ